MTGTNDNTSGGSTSEGGSTNPPATGGLTQEQKDLFGPIGSSYANHSMLKFEDNTIKYRNALAFEVPRKPYVEESIPGLREAILQAMTNSNRGKGYDYIFKMDEDLNALAQERVNQYHQIVKDFGFETAHYAMESHMLGFFPKVEFQMNFYNNDFKSGSEIFALTPNWVKYGATLEQQAKSIIDQFDKSYSHSLLYRYNVQPKDSVDTSRYGIGYAMNEKGSLTVMIVWGTVEEDSALKELDSYK